MKLITTLEWMLYILCILIIWPLPLLQYFIGILAIVAYGTVMYNKGKLE